MYVEDTISATTVARMNATLNLDRPMPRAGDVLPLGWHGLFCLPIAATETLALDGLAPSSDDEAANAEFPRRVFGGARITQHRALLVGDEVRCTSEVVSSTRRSGGSGEMLVVVLRHTYTCNGTPCIDEEQDIVQLPAATGPSVLPPGKPAPEASVRESVDPDSTLLFRFSALTFNSHRIHYDAPWAIGVEKMPALMVQGKLQAILAMGLVAKHHPQKAVHRFAYRSFRPIFAGSPFVVAAGAVAAEGTLAVWTADAGSFIALSATAEFDAR
jgi:3-methylfumaryl-CoA hydratase